MQSHYRPLLATYRQETPRPERVTGIGEALEEVLGAFAARQGGRSVARPAYSPVFVGAASTNACGSVMTR